MLDVEVCEIRGKCAVYKMAGGIVVDDPQIVVGETDVVYAYALFAALLHGGVGARNYRNSFGFVKTGI